MINSIQGISRKPMGQACGVINFPKMRLENSQIDMGIGYGMLDMIKSKNTSREEIDAWRTTLIAVICDQLFS